jgi:hypothetical protein
MAAAAHGRSENGEKKMLEPQPFAYACVDRGAWLPAQKTPQTTRTRIRGSLGSRSVSLSLSLFSSLSRALAWLFRKESGVQLFPS